MGLRHCHDFEDFRRLARRRLPRPIFDYIDGGADDEATLRHNTASFESCDLVPNVLRAYTGHPAKFRTFTAFYNLLMLDEETTQLSKLEREMIAVVVSSANRCYYCLVAHGAAVRQLSGDPELGEMMALNYRVAKLEARQRAMLDYAWKMTTTPYLVGDDDRDVLRAAGLSAEDVFDLSETVAFFNLSNRMASATDMMPNKEYHTAAR